MNTNNAQANKHDSVRPRSVLVPTNLVSTKDGATVRCHRHVLVFSVTPPFYTGSRED